MSSFSQTFGGLTVTLEAFNGNGTQGSLTFNAGDGTPIVGVSVGGSDLSGGGDGIGIGDDEITGNNGSTELLRVTFSSDVLVLGLAFLDLFMNEGPNADQSEVAIYALFDANGDPIGAGAVQAVQTQPNPGFVQTSFNVSGVRTIDFTAQTDGFSDYALSAIVDDPSRVPEPSTLAIFAFGLAGLGFMTRRRRRARAA